MVLMFRWECGTGRERGIETLANRRVMCNCVSWMMTCRPACAICTCVGLSGLSNPAHHFVVTPHLHARCSATRRHACSDVPVCVSNTQAHTLSCTHTRHGRRYCTTGNSARTQHELPANWGVRGDANFDVRCTKRLVRTQGRVPHNLGWAGCPDARARRHTTHLSTALSDTPGDATRRVPVWARPGLSVSAKDRTEVNQVDSECMGPWRQEQDEDQDKQKHREPGTPTATR